MRFRILKLFKESRSILSWHPEFIRWSRQDFQSICEPRGGKARGNHPPIVTFLSLTSRSLFHFVSKDSHTFDNCRCTSILIGIGETRWPPMVTFLSWEGHPVRFFISFRRIHTLLTTVDVTSKPYVWLWPPKVPLLSLEGNSFVSFGFVS